MFKHTVGTSYSTDAGTVINIPETITGSTSRDIDAVIGPGASVQYDVAIQPSSGAVDADVFRSAGGYRQRIGHHQPEAKRAAGLDHE
jgi:hypothetical protein